MCVEYQTDDCDYQLNTEIFCGFKKVNKFLSRGYELRSFLNHIVYLQFGFFNHVISQRMVGILGIRRNLHHIQYSIKA